MTKIFNIGLVVFLMGATWLHAQDFNWSSNNAFLESNTNVLTNAHPQSAFSYIMSAEVLASGTSVGNVSLTNFEISGNPIGNFNFSGSVTLGLSEDDNPTQGYRLVMFKTLLAPNGEPTTPTVRVFDPQGNLIGELSNITLSDANVLEIAKTTSNTLLFKYNGSTVATVSNAIALQYKALISTTIGGLSTSYAQSGFITTTASFPQPYVTDTDKNWTSIKTFDTEGRLTSANVNYYDCLGRGTQTQTKDLLTGKNWATEIRYDSQGRSTLSTLAAPISNAANFSYKDNFIVDSGGNPYNLADFENNPELPNIVGTTAHTLGAYYSTANTDEPYQDITDRPYSRTIYDELNPGAVRAVVGGNRALASGSSGLQYNFPQGYSHTMPAAQELYYAFGATEFPENREGWFAAHGIDPISVTNTMLTHRATKRVNIDAHGNETVVFTDLEGKTLAAARSGGSKEYQVRSVIGPQGYVDIHLPKGTSNADVSFIGGTSGYTVWDLRTGNTVSTNAMTGGHIYRIEYHTPRTMEQTILTINSAGTVLSQTGAKGLIYKVNYYDYALNYYDEKGNLLESVQPLGFDDAAITGGLNAVPQHSMINNYAYNSFGQLLNTSSPDEGNVSYIYRPDGQIRFSQNTKQEENGEFSYTLYDDYARPEESGVCATDFPGGGQGVVTSFNFIGNTPANMTFTGNSAKKVADNGSATNQWYRGAFYGTDVIEGDFKLTFTFPDSHAFFGLSATDYASDRYQYLDYSIWRYSNNVQVRQNNVPQTAYISGLADGFEMKIQRIGTTITYWVGETLLYTNTNATDGPLHLDGNIYYADRQIENIQLEYLNTSTTDGGDITIDPATCSERTFTEYDLPDQAGLDSALGSLPSRSQQFLAGNVSKTWTEDPSTNTTWYSYDIYGRVRWMVQAIVGLGTKIIDYEYHDITGEVIKITYSGEQEERFIHKYTYNDVGQLMKVSTSYDGIQYKEQARYEYYETGALKRTIIAEGIQGVDYVYNINGALKSINHPGLDANNDPGGDMNDVFGMIIDYHKEDYKRPLTGMTTAQGEDRYDGNIKATRWAMNNDFSGAINQSAYTYTYDHNSWLKSANFGSASNSGAITLNTNQDYKVSNLNYDPNGNIRSLSRNKDTYNGGNKMDNFKYFYTEGTNQLNYVMDGAIANEDAGDLESQNPGNYTYNSIGQLVHNAQDQIQYNYTTSGLVSSIVSTDPSNPNTLSFIYDDRGHRMAKTNVNGIMTTQTHYVRDASGQVLAIYNGSGAAAIEYPIYGTSRLGISRNGNDQYEITDHLGNVRAVVQDPESTGNNTLIFLDDFSNGVVSPWIEAHNPLVEASGVLKGTMDHSYTGVETQVQLPVALISGHQYRITLDNHGVSPLRLGIRAVNGGDSQEVLYTPGMDDHVFTTATSGNYIVYLKSANTFSSRSSFATYTFSIDTIQVEDVTSENSDSTLLAYRDYYPFGMPMPNRNVEGDYRYAYQGQEKDPETGKEAFELRLWDGRIGRWLTTDPAREFVSPYLGMANNPISLTDPDGGCVKCDPNAEIGSTATDAGGFAVTKTATGWVRDDGYVSDLGVIKGNSDFKSNYSFGDLHDAVSVGTLTFGVAEGALGEIYEFDKVIETIENSQFLSDRFNKAGEIRPYYFNSDGKSVWRGNKNLGYTGAMLDAEAKKFRFKAGTIRVIKAASVQANGIGIVLTVHDIGKNGLSLENGSDLIVGIIGYVPGYGWVVTSTYIVVKEGIKFTNRNVIQPIKKNSLHLVPVTGGQTFSGWARTIGY